MLHVLPTNILFNMHFIPGNNKHSLHFIPGNDIISLGDIHEKKNIYRLTGLERK